MTFATVGAEPAGADALPNLVDARQSLGPAVLDDLFPEGDAYRRSIVTFWVLLTLASFIASFGLFQDSVASIIGAMVVAPLGGAIMAFAGALVTARSAWQWRTLAQVFLGALLVVVVGYLVAMILPSIIQLTPSLKARTSPGLLDLGVALAAGAAGAYVAVRRTGSDALPGVAIAVSLVPPLATVGICLELGRSADAGGALLLFLTNFAAIVVAACIVFTLAGAVPSREMIRERHRVRNGFIAAIVLLVIVAAPLAWHGIETARDWNRASTGAPYVVAWIGGRDLKVTSWTVAGDTVTLDLTGTVTPPPAQPLANDLARAFRGPVDLLVNYTPLTKEQAKAAP